MDPTEARAILHVMLTVALADGELGIDEKRLLDVVAHHEYAADDPPESRFEPARQLERALSQIRSDAGKKLAWHGAVAIACVDAGCSAEEHRLLVRIHEKLLPDEPFPELTAAEEKYGRRFERIRDELREATAEFLHSVGEGAKGGKLAPREYEALANGLAKKKRELFARALSIPPPA